MTEEQYRDLAWEYMFGPYRVYQRILWVDYNEGAVVEWGRRNGHRPTFWTFTYANVDDLARCRKDWARVQGRLMQMYPDLCGVRFNQFGGKKGRFHVHAVIDRELPLDKVKKCLRGTTFGKQPDVERVRDDNLGGYLWKDMAKNCRTAGLGRRFATFGIFEGRTTLDDIVIDKGEFGECQEMARAERVVGENWRRGWERGWQYYIQRVCRDGGGEWGPFWERLWRAYAGVQVEYGDAYEDGGGGVEFDPKEWEA